MHETIARALRNEPLSLTSPRVTRDFIFIDDVVALFEEAMEKASASRGEIFNCGTGIATSLQEVASLVLAATNSRSDVRWGAHMNVSYDSDRWVADMTKTFAHFRWRPTHTMQDGIAKTVEWFRMARP
jgi:nucleoside-diphosphate-sugar epimerase